MGKKIAILIGVDKYDNASDLPPCRNDMELMSSFVSNSNHYEDFFSVELGLKASEVKSELTNFIRKYQEEEIEEVFFYYTGHGTTITDDFLYLFTDFDKSKIGQTTLKNSELDGMLKSLNPELAVKVVDACYSGTEYIKSDIDLQRVFEKSLDQKFKKTYFLFSSAKHEKSTALPDYSIFTKSFAKSLIGFEGREIRYRDIMDFISDDISVKKYQTPLFIQQADNTEVFGEISSGLVKELCNHFLQHSCIQIDDDKNQAIQIGNDFCDNNYDIEFVEKIKNISQKYCDEKEALQSVSNLGNWIKSYKWSETIQQIYEVKVEEMQDQPHQKSLAKVAEWIDNSDDRYFAHINYKDEEYKDKEKVEYESPFGFQSVMVGDLFHNSKKVEYQTVIRHRKVICGFDHSVTVPYASLVVQFVPKERALPWCRLFLTYTFSRSKITIFSKYEFEEEVNWQERTIQDEHQWKIIHCDLKDEELIRKNVEQSLLDVDDTMMDELRSFFC